MLHNFLLPSLESNWATKAIGNLYIDCYEDDEASVERRGRPSIFKKALEEVYSDCDKDDAASGERRGRPSISKEALIICIVKWQWYKWWR